MMHYFPTILPHETAYSWFSRYQVHSGCYSHKHALANLFCKRSDTASKEFVGNLNKEARACIGNVYPLEQLVLEHTMFPQYGRFLPLEKKRVALYKLAYENCDMHHLFCVLPRREGEQYLRYCPMCVRESREEYGEAYWDRINQIRDMRICTKHKCRLVESDVVATSHQSFVFCPAELHVKEENANLCVGEEETRYAEFIRAVFEAPIDFENDVPISAVLYHGMKKTKYLKSTGRSRYTKRFADDLKEFYKKIGINNIASMSQIQKTLLGSHCEFSVVCQIAFFLGMTVKELVSPKLTQEQIEEEQRSHYMRDSAPVDWEQLDAEKAPLLEQLAHNVYTGVASEMGRPERVSEKMVKRELGLLQHQLENMPKCRAILEEYAESYPECWARRIIWAYKKLQDEGEKFYWSDVRKIAGVKKHNFKEIKPYLSKHTDRKTVEAIINFVGDFQ